MELFHSFGVKEPKVACMCAVEEINPKMPETVEAAALKEIEPEQLDFFSAGMLDQ